MLAAVRAKAAGCPMAIALVNDPTLVPLMGPLDIDAYINPRATTVSSILRHIRHGRVRGVYSIGDAEAEVIEAQVLSTSPIAGQRVRDIDFPEGVLVGAVMKGGKVVKPTRRHPDRGGRRHRALRDGRRRARGRAAVAGLDRLLLSAPPRLQSLPLVVVLMGIGGGRRCWCRRSMPRSSRDWPVARAFFYSGLLFADPHRLIVVIATALGRTVAPGARRGCCRCRRLRGAAADAGGAVPRRAARRPPSSRPISRWCRRSPPPAPPSSTTRRRLPRALHLWRALVGWLGGFLMWVAAVALLAPLNLGGFEVLSGRRSARERPGGHARSPRVADTGERLARFTARLVPIYAGLTVLLWIGLLMAGRPQLRRAVPRDVDAGDPRHLAAGRARSTRSPGARARC